MCLGVSQYKLMVQPTMYLSTYAVRTRPTADYWMTSIPALIQKGTNDTSIPTESTFGTIGTIGTTDTRYRFK